MKYKTTKRMLKNRPLEIPEVQFRKLIRYWRLTEIKDELTSRIEAGQDHEEAFVQVLGKDQPGCLRCYGASVTKSSLKRHEEIRQVRGEYDQKVSSLERQMEGVCGLLTVMLQQMNPGKSEEDIAALVQAVRNSPSDASSRPKNTPYSSEATHFPPNDEVRN
ncbi:hypothetical protein PIB30_105571 [Stylosanthes scabra]|uniref:Transposase n=1 Tax=Stylosanthes scabra TaxID=79078 RepID=A0ABU6QY62_9FABA|nr:hypothetical protein [Stylosanthes scabra]